MPTAGPWIGWPIGRVIQPAVLFAYLTTFAIVLLLPQSRTKKAYAASPPDHNGAQVTPASEPEPNASV
jgi:hypothetical protein